MEFTAQIDALQVSRYEIDGNKGASIMARVMVISGVQGDRRMAYPVD
jgi:hypothetical protein